MAFWGIEVKPKQSHTLKYGDVEGKLILTQATLGAGGSTKKSILQCEVGDKSPVYLCTLLPDKIESCPLNLEFDEEDDVKFSVVGPTSVHLSGFIQGGGPYSDEDQEHDLYGEDIAETDSDESNDYSDDSEEEYDEDFINDGDMDIFPPSPVRNSGVVIEEIVDDEKPAVENEKSKQPGKKNQRQLVVKGTTDAAVLESEDEDGFPISSSREKEVSNDDKPEENTEVNATKTSSEGGKKKNKKRKNETKNVTCCGMDHGDVPEESRKGKKKKKDNSGEEKKTETVIEDKGHPKETNSGVDATQGSEKIVAGGNASGEKKKNKKKKKGKEEGSVAPKEESDIAIAVENGSATESGSKKSKAKPANVRNYANGLAVEVLEMGKPNGKRASPGKKVSVRYIGKLQKNGKIFDSNIGKAPFKFILGVGQVIKGWDVGVEGMRVGDKRKLTIPPSMAYGSKGVGAIPPNSWLEFNVELVEVS